MNAILKRNLSLGLIFAAALVGQLTPVTPLVSTAYAAETLRPEVGKPLQAAQDLIKQQKYKEALAQIGEADAIPNKTAYETFILERMRGAAAAGAGDVDAAAKAFDA